MNKEQKNWGVGTDRAHKKNLFSRASSERMGIDRAHGKNDILRSVSDQVGIDRDQRSEKCSPPNLPTAEKKKEAGKFI